MSDAAVITDIHANLPALEASLARIEELGIERIYCGGVLFVNCGSVGKPKDGDPRAAFASLRATAIPAAVVTLPSPP